MQQTGAAGRRDEAEAARGPVGGGPVHGPAGSGAPRASDDGWPAVLTVLLAGALVLHVLWWHGVAIRSAWLPVVAAAVVAVARPASVGRLAVLLATAALAIVLELPALGTHLLLVLGVAVCVLAHLALGLLRDRRLPPAAEVAVVLAPFLRASVVVLYVAAVLSKLNHDYVDASVTPVAALTAKVLWFAPDVLDGAGWRVQPAIWGSLLIELSLPVLLVVRRTRTAGLVIGLAFHGVLALSGTVPFTALMLALYVAFLPAGVVAGLARVLAGAGRGRRAELVAAGTVVLWIAVGTLATVDPGRVAGSVLASATRVLVAGASIAVLAAVVGDVRRRRGPTVASRSPMAAATRPALGVPPIPPDLAVPTAASTASVPRRASSPVRAVYAAGVVALVLVAAGPYVGVRTGDAFTMYSALDTSPGGWNHLLVPRAVRVLD